MDKMSMGDAVRAFCAAEGIDPAAAVVAAGGAMWKHGLREEVNDIDLLHPQMAGRPNRHVWVGGWEVDSGGFALPSECMDSVVIDGVRVQSPKALLAFYRRLDREKDQRWIRILSSIVEMEKEIWGLNGDESEIDLF